MRILIIIKVKEREEELARLKAIDDANRAKANENAKKLEGIVFEFVAPVGNGGRMIGTVSIKELKKALKEKLEIDVDKDDIFPTVCENQIYSACEMLSIGDYVLVGNGLQSVICLDALVVLYFWSAFGWFKACIQQLNALMYHRATLGSTV